MQVARQFSEKEGNAFLLGNGTNKPKGLLAYTLDMKSDAERDFGVLRKPSPAPPGKLPATT